MKKKKVVLVGWEMLETGGIIRIIMGMQTGFEKLGYETITYYGSRNGRLKLSTTDYTLMTKWFRPKADNLGWNNVDQMKEYRDYVRQSDLVLIIHPCPHPTKSGAGSDRGWQRVYEIPKLLGVPIGVIFTDNLWHRLYSWIPEVLDDVTILYNNYNAGFESMTKLDYPSQFVHYPMNMDEAKPQSINNRTIDISWLPQWKRWKGIYQLIKALSDQPSYIEITFFNTGIEYYNIRKLPMWAKAIKYDRFIKKYHNRSAFSKFLGVVPPDKVSKIYGMSKVTLDLSGMFAKTFNAQVTCAMIEGMMNGALVAAPPQVNENKMSLIRGMDLTWSVDPDYILESLAEATQLTSEARRITVNALAYVKENNSDYKVAQSVIDMVRN